MLERQHAQLIAGLQELYRRTQTGDGRIGPRLEVEDHNQPLTHKILESLGVLQSDDWEETESIDDGTWQGIERQGQENRGWMCSETVSPSTPATFSRNSPTQTAFSQSTIMSKRRLKCQTDMPPITQTLSMPPPLTTNFALVNPEAYTNAAFSSQMPTSLDTLTTNESTNMDFGNAPGAMMDWSFGMDDLFGNLGGQEQSVKGC